MISLIAVVSIILILVLIVLFVSYSTGLWTVATQPQIDSKAAIEAYNIPSAWTSSLPVADSKCQVYTFVATGDNVPQPSLAALDANLTGKFNVVPLNATCTDDDQIFAQQMFHVCRYGELADIPIEEYAGCRLRNGGFTKIDGYYESYYNTCGVAAAADKSSSVTADNSTRCPGSIGLIAYNFTSSLPSAKCILDPLYSIDGTNVIIDPESPLRVAVSTITAGTATIPPVSTGGCSISDLQNGLPSQLFRVIRYTYDGTTPFIVSNSGPWLSIVHRPSGKCLAPYTLAADIKTASVSSFDSTKQPIVIPCNSFSNVKTWFYSTPTLVQPQSYIRGPRVNEPYNPTHDPTNPAWDGKIWEDERLTALPQLIWAPDPKVLGPIKDDTKLWEFLTKNKVYSLVPYITVANAPDYSRMSLVPFITFKASSVSEASTIRPPNDRESIYYPNINGGIAYAKLNATNANSKCNGFHLPTESFLEIIPGISIPFTIRRPLTRTNPCYKEYALRLYNQYLAAIAGAKQRILAEAGSFNYIDLALYPVIITDAANFYDPNSSA
jgi:hypothetical protein